eukprot:scaffold22145_cov167-Amphora_coffeaeformis.AAC.6
MSSMQFDGTGVFGSSSGFRQSLHTPTEFYRPACQQGTIPPTPKPTPPIEPRVFSTSPKAV